MTDIDKSAQEALKDLLSIDESNIEEVVQKVEPEQKEVKKEVVEEKQDTTSELTDIEKEAYEQGWRPDGGEKSAAEFLRDGQFIDRIKEKGTLVKKKDKQIEALKSYIDLAFKDINKIKENAYKEALQKLESEKEDAIAMGEVDQVKKIDAEIKKAQGEHKANIPELVEFKSKFSSVFNPDTSNVDNILEANEIEDYIYSQDKLLGRYELTPAKHFEALESAVLKKYGNASILQNLLPEKEEVVEEKPKNKEEDVKAVNSAISSGNKSLGSAASKKKVTLRDLSAADRELWNSIKEIDFMDEETFIEGLRNSGKI